MHLFGAFHDHDVPHERKLRPELVAILPCTVTWNRVVVTGTKDASLTFVCKIRAKWRKSRLNGVCYDVPLVTLGNEDLLACADLASNTFICGSKPC